MVETLTTPVQIGPRVRAELERRVRELECRFKPAPRDMRELARLKEFLKVTPLTERDGRVFQPMALDRL
jgi:hypothetical protein